MIELYYWPTPNGHKITIFLEETGLPYRIIPINLQEGQQFEPGFLEISPNNKMPAIVDMMPADGKEPLPLFESGAILLYLADKTQKLIQTDLRRRFETIQWLFWQMAGLGPMSGQYHHFLNVASEKNPYAIERFQKEVIRLYTVLDQQLAKHEFITGEYSIADISCYPWIGRQQSLDLDLNQFTQLQRWYLAIQNRPAVQRAYAKGEATGSLTSLPITGKGLS